MHPLLATAARFSLAVIPVIFFVARPNVAWRYLVGYGFVFEWRWVFGDGFMVNHCRALIRVVVGIAFYQRINRYGCWRMGFLKRVRPVRKLIGAMLAMCALAVLVSAAKGNVTVNGVILIMIAACSWTLMGVIVKASKTKRAFAFAMCGGCCLLSIPLVLFAVMLRRIKSSGEGLNEWDWNTTLRCCFKGLPTTLFGYWVWNKLLSISVRKYNGTVNLTSTNICFD